MAAGNVQTITDPFGETWAAWTDGTDVLLQSDAAGSSPITCFSQPVSDGQIAFERDGSGRMYITYLDAGGARVTKYSDLDGDAGSWATL